jgi:hypothetical protein
MNPIVQAKEIVNIVSEEIQIKYAKGQKEHGGDFFVKPTVNNIREEVLDLVAYTHVLTKHKQELMNKLYCLQSKVILGKKISLEDVAKLMQVVVNL